MSGHVLVLNATGKVSAGIVEGLLAAGESVVAASRRPSGPERPGLRRVAFDYQRPDTFAAALDGVDRFFWMSPPTVVDGFAHTRAFLDRALGQVKKAVVSTAVGVEYSDEIPMRRVELHVERSGVTFVTLRPNWYMDNFHTFWLAPIQQAGVIPLPAADARSAFIDARDITDCAVAALRGPAADGRVWTLTGPQAFTYAEAAAILGRAAGRTITYTAIDDETFAAGARAAGLPADYAGLLVALFGGVRQGVAAAVTGDVQTLTGKAPRTLEEYARDHAAAWRA